MAAMGISFCRRFFRRGGWYFNSFLRQVSASGLKSSTSIVCRYFTVVQSLEYSPGKLCTRNGSLILPTQPLKSSWTVTIVTATAMLCRVSSDMGMIVENQWNAIRIPNISRHKKPPLQVIGRIDFWLIIWGSFGANWLHNCHKIGIVFKDTCKFHPGWFWSLNRHVPWNRFNNFEPF